MLPMQRPTKRINGKNALLLLLGNWKNVFGLQAKHETTKLARVGVVVGVVAGVGGAAD